ncbi:MAG: hypothetical protein QXK12_04370 [Candidatus Nezhaarchaeales archaeon]
MSLSRLFQGFICRLKGVKTWEGVELLVESVEGQIPYVKEPIRFGEVASYRKDDGSYFVLAVKNAITYEPHEDLGLKVSYGERRVKFFECGKKGEDWRMKLDQARREVEEYKRKLLNEVEAFWKELLKLPVKVETDKYKVIFHDNGEVLTGKPFRSPENWRQLLIRMKCGCVASIPLREEDFEAYALKLEKELGRGEITKTISWTAICNCRERNIHELDAVVALKLPA